MRSDTVSGRFGIARAVTGKYQQISDQGECVESATLAVRASVDESQTAAESVEEPAE